jgi:hypothetical protein
MREKNLAPASNVTGRRLQFAVSPADTLIPADIREKYDIVETRHAAAILVHDLYEEWNDVVSVLREFSLLRSDITAGGGNRSTISAKFDQAFRQRGWRERLFNASFVVDDVPLESKTHKVDCFKNRVALEIEWNNKDPFFDRDLNNFRLMFDIRAISAGVIITRSEELTPIFKDLGLTPKGKKYKDKYGASTTHMDKLLERLNGGGGGGCPVLAFGIRKALYDPSR